MASRTKKQINKNSKITVSVLNGPAGGYGFRRGNWLIKIGDINFLMYTSISHNLDLKAQHECLFSTVERRLEKAIIGETYITESGEKRLKYSSLMNLA